MATNSPKLYCAWFCPFAQRAWVAFLYKGVDFEYFEQNPYDKSPEWLAVNPRGLVPTILHNETSICDSVICIEYVDEAWPQQPHILPRDAVGRAHVRMWADHINKKIVPFYYAALLKRDKEDQDEATTKLLDGLRVLLEAKSTTGPFFTGDQFGYVDIMIVPYMIRFKILEAYRNFKIPGQGFEVLGPWMKSMLEMPCIKDTMPDIQKLIEYYNRYASDTAKTQVADAIRNGNVLP